MPQKIPGSGAEPQRSAIHVATQRKQSISVIRTSAKSASTHITLTSGRAEAPPLEIPPEETAQTSPGLLGRLLGRRQNRTVTRRGDNGSAAGVLADDESAVLIVPHATRRR